MDRVAIIEEYSKGNDTGVKMKLTGLRPQVSYLKLYETRWLHLFL